MANCGFGWDAIGTMTFLSDTDPSSNETKPLTPAGTNSVIWPDFLATGSEMDLCSQPTGPVW